MQINDTIISNTGTGNGIYNGADSGTGENTIMTISGDTVVSLVFLWSATDGAATAAVAVFIAGVGATAAAATGVGLAAGADCSDSGDMTF